MSSQSNPKGNELRVEMTSWENKQAYAKYNVFSVDDEKNKYRLTVGSYSGNILDPSSQRAGSYKIGAVIVNV